MPKWLRSAMRWRAGIRTGFESLDRYALARVAPSRMERVTRLELATSTLTRMKEIICRVAKSGNRRPTTSRQPSISTSAISGSEFINPHRLFHGVWLPQWLEERPELSEKAKKLYAYLTYFAGGKGYAWPSFNHLAGKLHISRRYVIKLVQELSAISSQSPTSPSQQRATARTITDSCGIPGCRPFKTGTFAWLFTKNSRQSRPPNPSRPLVNSRSLALVNWRTPAIVNHRSPPW